jgi:hypothetical protein
MDGTRERGFALAIVISLLTIASSLIIGFALLSNMENKKINNACHAPVRIAKQNALHALNEALAKLQAVTGQDTVATAKADILITTDPNNKHWVGVWKIDKCDETIPTAQDSKTFLTWLVSGNYTKETDSATTYTDKKSISIINPKYENIETTHVELIDTESSDNKGQYAYWIDDQSLKIQGNIYDSGDQYKDLEQKTSRTHEHYWYTKKQCQGKYGMATIPGGDECPLTQTFLSTHKHIPEEISYTNLLDASAASSHQQYLQQKFHDLTNLSLGLLTDTRNGGFRKNLRYKANGYLDEIPDGAFIFPPPTQLPEPPTTWGYLKSFFKINTDDLKPRPTLPLYRPQAGVRYEDCKLDCNTENGYTTGEISGEKKEDLGIATQYGIYPIWVEYKNYIILYYFNGYSPDNSDLNAGYYQSLRMQPEFHLENPYAYPIASSTIKIGQWSPYVANPENSDAERYQKQPTFRCKIWYNDGSSTDGLLQEYPNSENTGTQIFPFLNENPINYMRPVWEGTIKTNYPCNAAKYITLFAETSYIKTGRLKTLKTTEKNDPRDNYVNDIRFYQPELKRDEIAQSCWMESYPSPNQNDWNGTWKNDTDQWTRLCLRSTDSAGNILQQISDIEMKDDGNTTNRNTQCGDLGDKINKKIPIYLTCVSLRQNYDPGGTWHPYNQQGASVRPFIEANPCAPISCRTAHQDDAKTISNFQDYTPGNWSWDAHWLCLLDANNPTPQTTDHAILDDYSAFRNILDLPQKDYKLLNLGFLQHMNVGCFSYHPTYAFGNSYQNPHIPREKFFQDTGEIAGSTWPSHYKVEMLYDYSYCLNRALWDSYFIASNNEGEGFYLLNPRQKAFNKANRDNILSFNNAAENMAIHGAFNVNSTSTNAWAAFLGSTAGTITGNENWIEYSRIQTIQSNDNAGMRQLELKHANEIATHVVEQIKLRGVAGSIGEFVNRKLNSKATNDNKLGLTGAIQAAIDKTTHNSGVGQAWIPSGRTKEWFDDEASTGYFWAGKPGYLTQADVLQSIATPLCARGDTFCIHTYGNAIDKQGTTLAEVRCEAIVQRLPELLDQTNEQLGRKYKILAMKWITPPPRDN